MTKVPYTSDYTNKFLGFNKRTLEYIANSRFYTYNVLEGAIRSSKTVANIFAFAQAVEESKDRLHFAMGYSSKVAVKNIFESDGLGLLYFPGWQGRLSTKALGPNTYILVLDPPPGSKMPQKEIIPVGGGESDSEASFRGMSVGCAIITEANLMHPESLNALEKRTAVADIRRFFFDFNPSSPANFLYSWLGKRIHMNELPFKSKTKHPLGYQLGKFKIMQYLHMTFSDNLSMTKERIEELMIASDPESADFKRNILGERAAGAGKIYRVRNINLLEGTIIRSRYARYIIIIDPGQTASETAMIAMAMTNDKIPEIHILNEYSHTNNSEAYSDMKSETDYAYDSFAFIKESERMLGFQPWRIIVDPAAISFIREYNRNAKLNGIYYPLTPGKKREIDERIKIDIALLFTGRLKFHKFSGQKTKFEFEDAEYDEKKSMKGKYERLDDPSHGKQIGLIDCTEYGIEEFAYFIFNQQAGTLKEMIYKPGQLKT